MAAYSTYTDQELTALLKSDDHLAFNEIFKRYGSLLISFAYRKLYDKELAQDIVHDVFTDLWAKRLIQQISKGFEPFIFTSVKNRILDHYKHEKVSQRYLDNFKEYVTQTEDGADHLVRELDLSALIEKEIAALPEKMRVVFELSRNTDMSRKEIAEHLGIPEETVKTNMHRALKILKGRLGDSLVLIFF
ncbi:RNA polymerase sigma-70 factor [Pedobacter frigoris]|uniref:RNA polymerase sigma factor n=1 Tax=Pedobacter frigoris TaxID=2571272 RepID=UPI00292D0D51|nr:RNA polymerase sigma-70 factor [Pedobacter frigoris]